MILWTRSIPWGPEIEEFVSCVEARPPARERHRRAGAPGAARVAGGQSLARERQGGGGVVASLHERLFSRIDALHDETVSLIQELVRVNSITPTLPGVARADVIGRRDARERDPARALRAGRPRDALGGRGSGATQPRRCPSRERRRALARPQRSRRHRRAGRAGRLAGGGRPGTRRCATAASTGSARRT